MDDKETSHGLLKHLYELHVVRAIIDRQIAEIELSINPERTDLFLRIQTGHRAVHTPEDILLIECKTGPRRRRGRKPGTMSQQERQQVSERMRRYWARRRGCDNG